MKYWDVLDAETLDVLGTVEKYYRNCGTAARPTWRMWFRDASNPNVTHDRRTGIADAIGAGRKVKLSAGRRLP